MTRLVLLLAAALVAGAASAHEHHDTFAAGAPAAANAQGRDISVAMTEKPDGTMAFDPARLEVSTGDTVHFTITNRGKARHEFRLDSVAGNAAHKAMMAQMPGMVHHDPNAATLAPGATARLAWRFTTPGTYEFACLIPGHYEAGMHGAIVVAK